jgi:hypothetical protein
MAKYLMAVYSNAVQGRSDDYERWYADVHLHDICALPGVTSGHFHKVEPTSPVEPIASYLATYELDVDDPMSVLQEMGKRAQAGQMQMTDAIDLTSAKITLFKQKA